MLYHRLEVIMTPNKRFTVDCLEYFECSCPILEDYCENSYREFDITLCLCEKCDGEGVK